MKSSKSILEEGGPAFPHVEGGSERFGVPSGWEGMTLRDYFAGQALTMLVRFHSAESAGPRAYEYADEMLKARKQ